jgi:Mn-dependent DtxR family transcriptional regulator
MNFHDRLHVIERIDALIKRKGTGSPSQLASRLGISERSVYAIIQSMKELGAPIYYDHYRLSYCYSEEGKFVFSFQPLSNQYA